MVDGPLFEYLYNQSPKQLRHYQITTKLQGFLADVAELVYPLFILAWALIERRDQVRYYVCNDAWTSQILNCLFFFAQQRSLFNILKNVFRLTRILSGSRRRSWHTHQVLGFRNSRIIDSSVASASIHLCSLPFVLHTSYPEVLIHTASP